MTKRKYKSLHVPALCCGALILCNGFTTLGATERGALYQFQFAEEPASCRQMALGSSGTAGAASGFSFYNPAIVALAAPSQLSFDVGTYPGLDQSRWSIETMGRIGSWGYGASARVFTIDNIQSTSEQAINLGTPFSQQQVIATVGAGYSTNLGEIGLSFTALHDRLQVYDAWGWSVSGGLRANIIPGKLSTGASLMNATEALKKIKSIASSIKTTTGYLSTTNKFGQGDGLPLWGSVGCNWVDTIKSLPYAVSADFLYRDQGNQVLVPLGIEITPIPRVSARIGKRWGYEGELFACGGGVVLDPISVDCTFWVPSYSSDQYFAWVLALTYRMR